MLTKTIKSFVVFDKKKIVKLFSVLAVLWAYSLFEDGWNIINWIAHI